MLDAITVSREDRSLSVLLGKGDGTFGDARHTAASVSPESLAIADFDRDTIPDVAVTGSPNTVLILLGLEDGSFEELGTVATGDSPRGIIAAHLNADDKVDLVTANTDSADVSVLLGEGDGGFESARSFAGDQLSRASGAGGL